MSDNYWRARERTEEYLRAIWKVDEVETDVDGEYPYRAGTTLGYVGVSRGRPTKVKVWAVAARETKKSLRLLDELNDINLRCAPVATVWQNGAVLVQHTSPAPVTDQRLLHYALDTVATIANDIGVLIAAVHGGEVPFPSDGQQAS